MVSDSGAGGDMTTDEQSSNAAVDADGANIRVLKAVVIGLGVLILLGLIGLAAGLIWRAGQIGQPTATQPRPAPPIEAVVTLPPGARVIDQSAVGTRLVLRVELGSTQGQRLLFIDPASGTLTGQLDLAPAK